MVRSSALEWTCRGRVRGRLVGVRGARRWVGEWSVHRRVGGALLSARRGMSWRRECACRDRVRCPLASMWVGCSSRRALLALSRSGERRISRCDEWAVHAIASESATHHRARCPSALARTGLPSARTALPSRGSAAAPRGQRYPLGATRLALPAWRYPLGATRLALPAWRYPLGATALREALPASRSAGAPAHPRKHHHHQPGGQRIGCGTYFEASGNRSSTSSTRATTAAT